MNRLVFLTAGLLLATQAHAAQFCATNSSEFQAHLDTAESNGEDDVIRLETGTYIGNFLYNPVPGEAFALSLEGGYTEFFSLPCGRLQSAEPGATVLDGNFVDRVLRILGPGGSSVHIRSIAFINGVAAPGLADAGGLTIFNVSASLITEVSIENTLFFGNAAVDGSGAISIRGAETVRISNSLLEANDGFFGPVVSIDVRAEGLQFINNTVINNTTPGDTLSTVYIQAYDTAKAVLVNNLFWGNEVPDIGFFGGGAVYLYNNNIEEFNGSVTESVGNLSIAPEFQQNSYNYELVPDSPLVDAGRLPPPPMPSQPFQDSWVLPATDIRNAERVQGASVDIGAFESTPDWLFRDRFEVP